MSTIEMPVVRSEPGRTGHFVRVIRPALVGGSLDFGPYPDSVTADSTAAGLRGAIADAFMCGRAEAEAEAGATDG